MQKEIEAEIRKIRAMLADIDSERVINDAVKILELLKLATEILKKL